MDFIKVGRAWSVAAVFIGVLLLGIVSAKTIERPDLKQLFRPQSKGWLGADVALSIPVGNLHCLGGKSKCPNGNSYLWVWGDTLVGNLVGGERNITRMPHDSFGLISNSAGLRETKALQSSKLLHQKDKQVRKFPSNLEYFIPDSNWGFFRPPDYSSLSYYWVVAGMLGPFEKLFFIAMRIRNIPSGLGFEQVGSDLIVVDKFKTGKDKIMGLVSPSNWTYRTSTLPNSKNNCSWNSGVTIANKDGRKVDVRGSAEDRYVYVIGRCLWPNRGYGGALSRFPVNDFLRLNFSTVSYLRYDGTWTSPGPEQFQLGTLNMLFPSTFTEGVLTFNNYLNAWYIMLCQSTGPQINITYTNGESLFSNWTMRTVYTVPSQYSNYTRGITSYAAKQHIELAPATSNDKEYDRYIVFSYNSNSIKGLEPLVKDLNIYTPNFVQIDLGDFFGK